MFNQEQVGPSDDPGSDFVTSQILFSGGLFTPENFPATRSLDLLLSSNAATPNGDFLTVYNDRQTEFGDFVESYTGIDFAGANIFGLGSASPPDLEHPQLAGAINAGTFGFFGRTVDGELEDGGFHAIFDVGSVSVRAPILVSEPSMMQLFAAALAALGCFALRRATFEH